MLRNLGASWVRWGSCLIQPAGASPSPAEMTWPPLPVQGLTAYHDISLDKCYVIELNTTIVLPPRNFWELLMNVKVSRALAASSLPCPPSMRQGKDGGPGRCCQLDPAPQVGPPTSSSLLPHSESTPLLSAPHQPPTSASLTWEEPQDQLP